MKVEELTNEDGLLQLLLGANELRNRQDYRGAIGLYEQAVTRFGESAGLLRELAATSFQLYARMHGALEPLEAAVAWITKAIALAPDRSELHEDLADFLWHGYVDYGRAIQELRRAIELNPRSVRALSGAALLYGTPENVVGLDEATSWLERAVRLAPDDPLLHASLGDLYSAFGHQADADHEWEKALLCPEPLDPGRAQGIEAALKRR